jgi:CheY-like chemotaxis protein
MAITGNRTMATECPRPWRVLIVDDDPAIRFLCSINLQLEGLLVLEAPDGRRGPDRAVAGVLAGAGSVSRQPRLAAAARWPPVTRHLN